MNIRKINQGQGRAGKRFRKFQEGGAMAADEEVEPGVEGAEAPEETPTEEPVESQAAAQDPLTQSVQMMAQAYQARDCNALMQAVGQFLSIIAQQSGGGGAPAEQGEPVFRSGGVLIRRMRKAK